MKHHLCLLGLLCLACGTAVAEDHPQATFTAPQSVSDASEMRLRIAGLGGVYFLAQPGTLDITFYRMEWTDQPEPVRLILVSPNREVLMDTWLAGQGKEAGKRPIVKTAISCPVPAAGVYGLMLSCPTDRYGTRLRWSFNTNCPRYLIETSGGHKDERHREPLTTTHYDAPGRVYFWPSAKSFSGHIDQILPDSPYLRILDDTDKPVLTLTPDAKHTVDFTLPADSTRRAPWAIDFGKMHGSLTLDSLTQWDHNTPFEHLSLWTDQRSAWFDYYTNRKLLTPYNLRLNRPARQQVTADFTLRNDGNEDKHVRLALEYPEGTQPFAMLPFTDITLQAHKQLPLPIVCTVASVPTSCRLRVTTDDGFTTYSTIALAPKAADAEYAIPTPLQLTPYHHQNVSCAYYPDYPLDAQPYFNNANEPYMQANGFIYTSKFILPNEVDINSKVTAGPWKAARWNLPDGTSSPVSFLCSKIAFDYDNWAYTLISYKGTNYLAYSYDRGDSFNVVPIPAKGAFDIEQFSGHNTPPGPPPFAVYTMLQNDPTRIWRAFYDCKLFIPVKQDKSIIIQKPIMVTDTCIGISLHSGIPSTIASHNGKTFIIWGETTDPADKSIPGVPTRLAMYDHASQTLTKGPIVGYGPPANDVHNTPCLTIDGNGIIHALVGTHGSTFIYSHSLKPDSVMDGWSPARPVGEKLGQTYLGLVCDQLNNLHMVFRLWGNGPNGLFAQLAMMTKPANSETWSAPQVLVKAAFNDYSVFYHRFVIDRTGRLYLSFDYWSTYWFYRNDQPRNWRSLIVSNDGGKHWQMAKLDPAFFID